MSWKPPFQYIFLCCRLKRRPSRRRKSGGRLEKTRFVIAFSSLVTLLFVHYYEELGLVTQQFQFIGKLTDASFPQEARRAREEGEKRRRDRDRHRGRDRYRDRYRVHFFSLLSCGILSSFYNSAGLFTPFREGLPLIYQTPTIIIYQKF